MDRVSQGNASIATLTQTQTQQKKDYQKYFDYGTARESAKVKTSAKVRAYSRPKAILITGYFIAGFLIALFVANFIIISSMNTELQASTQVYTEMVQQNEEYLNAINEATQSDSVEAKMVEAGFVAGMATTYDYVESNASEVQDVPNQSNWYDRFVAFVSRVFGG